MTIHPGRDPDEEPLLFFTNDTHTLRALIAECKRFKDQIPGIYRSPVETSDHEFVPLRPFTRWRVSGEITLYMANAL